MSIPSGTQEISFSQLRKGSITTPDNYLLNKFSATSIKDCRGAYSLKLVNNYYTGPIIKLRRRSDNQEQDFYSDNIGNLTTKRMGDGSSIDDWLGTSDAYVKTWYDQSDKKQHITQTCPPAQPTFSITEKYPSGDLSAETTILSNKLYGNGTYSVTASSSQVNEGIPAYAFNSNLVDYWHSNSSLYNGTTGQYTGAQSTVANNGIAYNGEWLQIRLPAPIALQKFTMTARQNGDLFTIRSPRSFAILGSTDGVFFKLVHEETNVNNWTQSAKTFLTNSTDLYTYYRLVVRRVGTFDNLSSHSSGGVQDSVQVAQLYLHARADPQIIYNETGNVGRFPPEAMSAATTTISNKAYGNGTYIASASSQYPGEESWRAFAWNSSDGTTVWTVANQFYYTNGQYVRSPPVTTTIDGVAYAGEWLQLQLPTAILLTDYYLYGWKAALFRSPKKWWVAGSNDGTTWTMIDSRENITRYPDEDYSFKVQTIQSTPYSYYRIVVNQIDYTTSGSDHLSIAEWVLVSRQYMNIDTKALPMGSMTSNVTRLAGEDIGNGWYTASASTVLTGFEPWLAFNNDYGDVNTSFWHSAGGTYTQSTGVYSGSVTTTVSGSSVAGEWLEIKLPNPIPLGCFSIAPRKGTPALLRSPRSFVVAGSNDRITWTSVFSITGITDWADAPKGFTTGSTTPYYYYRLITREVGNTVSGGSNQESVQIAQWNFFTAEASSTYSTFYAYNAFDSSDSFWHDVLAGYNNTTGTYTGALSTVANGVTYNGEWLQLQLPYAIPLRMIHITPRAGFAATRSPRNFVILGSNNGSTWNLVYTGYQPYWNGNREYFQVDSTTPYSYYRLVALSLGNIGQTTDMGSFNLGDVKLYTSLVPIDQSRKMYSMLADWSSYTTTGDSVIVEQFTYDYIASYGSTRAALLRPGSNYGFNGAANDSHSLVPLSSNMRKKTVLVCNHTLSAGNINIYDNGILYEGTTLAPLSLNITNKTFQLGGSSFSPILLECHSGTLNELIVFNNALQPSEALIYNGTQSTLKTNLPDPAPDIWVDFNPRDNTAFHNNMNSYAAASLDLRFLQNQPHNTNISNWNGYAQSTSSNQPLYFSYSGFENNGFVQFDRTASDHLNGGSKTLNINTNGGFTTMVFMRFTGTTVAWERIFDFGNLFTNGGVNNYITFGRFDNSTTIFCEFFNGSTNVARITGSNVITQNEWALFAVRYRKESRLVELFKNGVLLATTTASADILDRTVPITFIGRSNYEFDPYVNADIAGLYVLDKYLSTSEMGSIAELLMYPTVLPVPKPLPLTQNVKTSGYVQYYPFRQGYSGYFSGNDSAAGGVNYVKVTDIPTLPFTMAFWFNVTSTTYSTIIGLSDFRRSGSSGIQIDYPSAGQLTIYAALPTAWANLNISGVNTNVWHHLCLMFNTNNTIDVYMSGTFRGTITGSATMPRYSVAYIGASGDGTRGYTGHVADFRIYNRILDAEEYNRVWDGQWQKLNILKSPQNFLVNASNWTSAMTRTTEIGGFSSVVAGAGTPRIQLSSSGTNPSRNSVWHLHRIQDYESFTASFEVYYIGNGGDALSFFFGGLSTPVYPSAPNGAYSVVLRANTSAFSPPGVLICNHKQNFYNYSNLPNGNYVKFSTKTKWLSDASWQGNFSWVPVTVNYNKNKNNTLVVTINGEELISYSDPNIDKWLTGTGRIVQNGLIAHFDPFNVNSYPGSGNTITSLVSGTPVVGTLTGNYSYDTTTKSIRLTNSNVNGFLNTSVLQLPTLSGVRTISIWYYQHSNATTRYLLDMRDGATNGYIYNLGQGDFWTGGSFYKNGGASQVISVEAIETLGVWQNITLITPTAATDDITLFGRVSQNEGLDVTFGPIFIYNRVITEAENLDNFNAVVGRYGNLWGISSNSSISSSSPNIYVRRMELSYTSQDVSMSTLRDRGFSNNNAVAISDLFTSKMGLMEGLMFKMYNGNFDGTVEFFEDRQYMELGRTSNVSNLLNATYGSIPSDNTNNTQIRNLFSVELFGYFRPHVSGNWGFKLSTDDKGYLWLGSSALSGYTTGNYAITTNNNTITTTVALTAGVYYAIRIQYGENTGSETFQFTFTPPGGSETSDGRGYFFCPTGNNSNFPAENAKVIKDLTKTNEDGVYYINCTGTSTATYCLMNSMYDGGGWMMMMKGTAGPTNDGTAGTTFGYSANYWTTSNTLNSTDLTRNNANAKYDVFNKVKIKDTLAIFPDIDPFVATVYSYSVRLLTNPTQFVFYSDLDPTGNADRRLFPDGKSFKQFLQKNDWNAYVRINNVSVHIHGLLNIIPGAADFSSGSTETITVLARRLDGSPIATSTFGGSDVTVTIDPLEFTSGSIPISDGWTWKVENWTGSTKTTALAGFQSSRDATPSNPFEFSGYDGRVWSQQYGNSNRHILGGGSHLGISSTKYARWGMVWNNENDLASIDCINGIGLGNGWSAGDENAFPTFTRGGINRKTRFEMYGR